jgi:hypothetical protein
LQCSSSRFLSSKLRFPAFSAAYLSSMTARSVENLLLNKNRDVIQVQVSSHCSSKKKDSHVRFTENMMFALTRFKRNAGRVLSEFLMARNSLERECMSSTIYALFKRQKQGVDYEVYLRDWDSQESQHSNLPVVHANVSSVSPTEKRT